jgi:hypothetical protein
VHGAVDVTYMARSTPLPHRRGMQARALLMAGNGLAGSFRPLVEFRLPRHVALIGVDGTTGKAVERRT